MKVAVGQLCSSSNPFANARVVTKLIDKAIASSAKVLFLPEATDYLGSSADHSRQLASLTPQFLDKVSHHLREQKGDLHVAIGVHLAGKEGKIKNCHLWLNPNGEVEHNYQKIHLFDVNVPNGPILMESKAVEPGTKLVPPFSVGPFRLGLAICYDIRFPELSLDLFKAGANILAFPSAFTTVTGKAHWQLLGKARAIDTQSYVVMAAQCGVHHVTKPVEGIDVPEAKTTQRVSYGNSIVIDPWGSVVAELPTFESDVTVDKDGDYYDLIVTDLDIDLVTKTRINMPLLAQRRPYSLQ